LKIFGLSTDFGRVMSFVIPIVGTLAVHVAFSVGGAVPLPVAASCVEAATAVISVGSSEARVPAMVGSLTVAVPSEIISCAPLVVASPLFPLSFLDV